METLKTTSAHPPLVSVIIPTYNRAALVGRAIKSALLQTFRDFELIVVDDGSTDSTAELLEQYQASLTALHQPNRGVAAARNRGIHHSCGRLIAFLDSDDEWVDSKLERQVAQYCFNDNYFICHTDEIWLRDGRQIQQKTKHHKQGGRFFERALELCLISPSSVMISRRLLDKVGWFDESMPAAEDYDLWLRITAFWEVEYIDEPLVIKYGGHADQLSRTTPMIDQYRIRAIEKILRNPELSFEYRNAAIRELKRKCGIVAQGSEKHGNRAQAEHYLELAQSYSHSDTQSNRD